MFSMLLCWPTVKQNSQPVVMVPLIYFSLFALVLLHPISEAAPEESLITHLPGFNGTFPSKHYAGYISLIFFCHLLFFFLNLFHLNFIWGCGFLLFVWRYVMWLLMRIRGRIFPNFSLIFSLISLFFVCSSWFYIGFVLFVWRNDLVF